MYDRPTVLDADDQLVPGLATEWKFVDDGLFLDSSAHELGSTLR